MTKRIRIVHDNDYQWNDDCLTIVYLNSSRYQCGNKTLSRDEMYKLQKRIDSGEIVGLPVYAYIHCGVTLSTSPFNDPWDSGRSGFVYSDLAGTTPEMLKAGLEEYNKYLAGDTWGFVVEEAVELIGQREDGTTVEREEWVKISSCWGFLGRDPQKNGMADACEDWLKEGYVFVDEHGDPL